MLVFNKKPFIIADISLAYYEFAKQEEIADIEAAKFLIDEAQSCGVDAVMFQSFKAENVLSRDSSALDELGLSMDYFDSWTFIKLLHQTLIIFHSLNMLQAKINRYCFQLVQQP